MISSTTRAGALPSVRSSLRRLLCLLLGSLFFAMSLAAGWSASAAQEAFADNARSAPVGERLMTANDNLYGGIEIGAKGVKAIALQVSPLEDGYYEVESRMPIKDKNTTIMAGVKETGRFAAEAIKETAQAVNEFFKEIRDTFKVPVEHIYIAGSSGLQANNKDELAAAIEKLIGKKMIFLDTQSEVEYSILGIIARQHRRTGILIDIGSGNTKGGYREGAPEAPRFVTMSIPFGTVTFTNELYANGASDTEAAGRADALCQKLVTAPLRQQIDRKPGLINRKRAYLTGGIVWTMATLLHPANRRALVRITASDINEFAARVRKDAQSLLNPDLSTIKIAAARQQAEQDVQKIRDTFTPRNLLAGAEILKAFSSEFNFAAKYVYFARYGQIGWLLSYVETQAREELENEVK